MTQHIVKLVFIYDEEQWPEVIDEDSAIAQAQKELEEQPIHCFDFDYDKV